MKPISITLLLFSIAFGSSLISASPLPAPIVPNPSSTSGSRCSKSDRDYTQDRYAESIPYCKRNVSSQLKKKIYKSYGVPGNCQVQYTIDHFYPLSLGGDNTILNLWPEHKAVKSVRQDLEMELFLKIERGDIKQEEALKEIEDAKTHPDISQIPAGDYCDLFPKKSD